MHGVQACCTWVPTTHRRPSLWHTSPLNFGDEIRSGMALSMKTMGSSHGKRKVDGAPSMMKVEKKKLKVETDGGTSRKLRKKKQFIET
ncbi:hypothetical protein Hanom_Chr04g00361801 [Helianthus anomalus]